MMNTQAVQHTPIPPSFTKKGFCYRQVRRQGDVAIFEQTRKDSEFKRYEVVKIGRHNGYTMGGAYIAPAETYPGSSLWGITGWTCEDLSAANQRFEAMQQ